MKPLPIILAILLISCTPPEPDYTTVTGVYAPFFADHEVNRVEIDINGRTYKILANTVHGGGSMESESGILPSGEVTRVVFYLYDKAVYEAKPLGYDKRTVIGTPFTWYGGEGLVVQVYLIE